MSVADLDIPSFLQKVRAGAGLNQRQWSERSGVAQSSIASYESGRRVPTLAVLVQLLDPLGLSPRLAVEPAWRKVDAAIDACRGESVSERVWRLPWYVPMFVARLGPPVWMIGGAAAAVLQGVPLPADRVEVWLPDVETAIEEMADAMEGWFTGWDAVEQMPVYVGPSPEEFRRAETTVWRGSAGVVAIRLCDPTSMPVPVLLEVDGQQLRVVPLFALETSDPVSARMLERVRSRYADSAAAKAS